MAIFNVDPEEFKKLVESWHESEIERRVRQWVQRIDQFLVMGEQEKGKKLFHQLKAMIDILKYRKKVKTGEMVLDKTVQDDILSEESIDSKLARYYQKFCADEPVIENSITETGEVPDENAKEQVKEEGYSLTILKQLSGSNPLAESSSGSVSEKDLGFGKLKKKKTGPVSKEELGFGKLKKKKKTGSVSEKELGFGKLKKKSTKPKGTPAINPKSITPIKNSKLSPTKKEAPQIKPKSIKPAAIFAENNLSLETNVKNETQSTGQPKSKTKPFFTQKPAKDAVKRNLTKLNPDQSKNSNEENL